MSVLGHWLVRRDRDAAYSIHFAEPNAYRDMPGYTVKGPYTPPDQLAGAVDRLTQMNECVRIYLNHDGAVRPGWLEEEVAATDAYLNRGQ
jgi:hypothetical protein